MVGILVLDVGVDLIGVIWERLRFYAAVRNADARM